MGTHLLTSYSSITNIEHRQKFGQFFTEPGVARFMANWLIARQASTLLDPAFGLGVFAEEATRITRLKAFKAYELDPHAYQFSKKHFKKTVDLKNADYLKDWKNDNQEAIICNPPYMKFQNFNDKKEILQKFQKHLGLALSGYTNIASAFLLKSISELKEGGSLAYIMPFEFMNAGYGTIVKHHLLERGEIAALIKLECEKDVFAEVTTSVGIILFTKRKKPKKNLPFYVVHHLSELTRLEELTPVRALARDELKASDKWAKHFEVESVQVNPNNLVPLHFYGSFSRGIATGANDYFSFNSSKIKEFKLPSAALLPCITKSNQIKTQVFDQPELDDLIKSDSSVYLVNLESALKSKAVQKYIQLGEDQKIHQRYLTKMRSPWYKLEKRKVSSLLFGVFSRDGYKVIRNLTQAIHLTCFHGFNVNPSGEKYLDLLFFYLMSDAGRKIMQINMRKYGDGLDKFEPNDLNTSWVPSPQWFQSLKKIDIEKEYASIRSDQRISNQLNRAFDTLVKASLE